MFEDAQPALKALAARGFRLGIISNWDERLRPLLDELNLATHFRALTISCEAGHTKPDRHVFLRAAAELGCEPAAIVHVGDSTQEDAEGALAAGLQAVLVDRSRRDEQPSESAGFVVGPYSHVAGYGVITSLASLPASLDSPLQTGG